MKSLLSTKTKMKTYKSIAVLLNAGQYTIKRNRYCAPHMIAKPVPGLSLYSAPRRMREMRELGLCESNRVGRVVGFALTEEGVKLAKSK